MARREENKDFNPSTLFDNFDIDKNSLIDKVVNYVFPSEDVYKDFLRDTIKTVKLYELNRQRDAMLKQITALDSVDARIELMRRIKIIDEQIIKEKHDNR